MLGVDGKCLGFGVDGNVRGERAASHTVNMKLCP